MNFFLYIFLYLENKYAKYFHNLKFYERKHVFSINENYRDYYYYYYVIIAKSYTEKNVNII